MGMSAEVLTKPAVSTAIRDDHPEQDAKQNRLAAW
jgi:hypothetical protein